MTLKNLSFFLVLVVLASCQKEDENSMDFKITGIHDTIIQRGQQFSIPLKVFYLGGGKENVTITSSGNGKGCSLSYNPVTGEPDFSFTEYINASATADTGLFTITVTGTSESNKQFSKSFKLHVTEVSNSAPVLVLTQGDTIDHRLNDPWIDPGAIAIDPEDGNISAQVQVSGTVNVNLMSNYLLTYTITDSDGLTASDTRLVRVLNDAIFVNGQYNCTTFSSGPNHVFTTTIAASSTVNNEFKLYKIGDNFQADPIIIYNPVNDSIFMSAQTFTITNGLGTFPHTFQGSGKITYTGGSQVSVDLVYTESYIDPVSTLPVVLNKRDLCTK